MSNGTPPIQPAPVPPSVAGIPQPVYGSGSATVPPTPIPNTGAPTLPPPLISNPPGVPVFPPTGTDTAPVPVPVGPLVGPRVPPTTVPPSIAGIPQPIFGSGNAAVPPGYFPLFSTTPPSPPIVFANIFNMGNNNPPPSTPGQNPPAIVPSPVPTIPQLPWRPPTNLPPVNTVPPTVTVITGGGAVGSQIASNAGTWTPPPGQGTTFTRQWYSAGAPIPGATATSYIAQASDVGNLITCAVVGIYNGVASAPVMSSNSAGPITSTAGDAPVDDEPTPRAHRPANRRRR